MSAVTWSEVLATPPPGAGPASRRPSLYAVSAPAAGRGLAPLVLTRRGRLVRFLAAVALVVAAWVAWGVQASSAAPVATAVTVTTVTVAAGETLSDIVVREMPGVDVRDGVAMIQIANNLSSSDVLAGQQIAIPAS